LLDAIITGKRPPLTRDAFQQLYAPDPAVVARVVKWARAEGLSVVRADPAS
jgi:hypothetical protein